MSAYGVLSAPCVLCVCVCERVWCVERAMCAVCVCVCDAYGVLSAPCVLCVCERERAYGVFMFVTVTFVLTGRPELRVFD
jgi:hypothetical protein